MVERAVVYAVLAMVSWGLWAALMKIATASLTAQMTVLITYVIGAVLAGLYIISTGGPETVAWSGAGVAVIGGIFYASGGLFYYISLQHGRTIIATPIAAMYFLVTAVLAFVFLNESIGVREAFGLVLGSVALVLLST